MAAQVTQLNVEELQAGPRAAQSGVSAAEAPQVPPDERMTILPSGKRACARCSGNYAGLADKRNGWVPLGGDRVLGSSRF